MWNEIIHPLIPKLQRLDKQLHHTLYCACAYLSLLGWKIIQVSKLRSQVNAKIVKSTATNAPSDRNPTETVQHLSVIDSFTVALHSPNDRHLPAVRAEQRDCHCRGLENGGNPHWSREPMMQWDTRKSQSIFRTTNHKSVMPANWRPCLIPHWQSHCHPLGLCSSLSV